MTVLLFEKYRPKIFSEIKGQSIAVAKTRAFVNAFNRGAAGKKALLLHGPVGTGKTTLAHVFAKENQLELFELNASDLRNRKKLDEIMKPSTLQSSLFAKGKVILVDEVDGVTSTEYGGLTELIALIENSKFPVVITANDVWQRKFSLLRRKCELVQMKGIPYVMVFDVLREITEKENGKAEEHLLQAIATKARGDLRAAINDLQSVLYRKEESGEAEIEGQDIGEREKTQDIFNALKVIFKIKTDKDTIKAYDNTGLDGEEVSLWLEKNIPKEYRGKELAAAFEALSKADVFRGRVHRQQHWRFLVYQNAMLSAGVSSAKAHSNPESFTRYEKPTRILKIWMANQKYAKKKSIAAKYAEYAHISKKRALKDFFLIALTLNDELAEKLNLSEQEKEFLTEYKGAIKVAHNLNRFALKN